MRKQTLIVIIFSFLLASCYENDVMDQIIFIPDKHDPNLPAYSEWGYNTFGAKYGIDYFVVSMSNYITPCAISYSDHQFQFELRGIKGSDETMWLLFIFPSEPMSDYKDLVKLPKNEIVLSAANDCTVKINNTLFQELNGKLHFKRVQLLRIDGTMERAILSGIFELNFTKDGSHETISNGRFDLGINDKVFYSH